MATFTVFFACALDMSNQLYRETFLSSRGTLCPGDKPQSIARLISYKNMFRFT